MHSTGNDQELVQRAKAGDKEAVSTLYETHARAIFQYISYRVENDAIAEDLTAEVFLRMVRGLATYEYTGVPFGAWLYRIAANQVADYYRKNRHMTTAPIPENYQGDAANPFDEVAKEEERTSLRMALQALSEDYQNVIILRFMKDLPHAEVAEMIGKSEGAVRVLQHRALKALGAELERQERWAENDE